MEYTRTDNPCYDTMALLCYKFFDKRDLSVFVYADPQRVSNLLDVANRRDLIKKEDYIELNKRLRYYINNPQELETNIFTEMVKDKEKFENTKASYNELFGLISGEKYYEEFKRLKTASGREQKAIIDDAVLCVMASDILVNIAQKKDDYMMLLPDLDPERAKQGYYKEISYNEAKKNAIEKIEIFSKTSESNPGWYLQSKNNVKRFVCNYNKVDDMWYGFMSAFSRDMMQNLGEKKADFPSLSAEVRDKKYHDFLVALKADKEEGQLLELIQKLRSCEMTTWKNVELIDRLRNELKYKAENLVKNSGLELKKMAKLSEDFYKINSSMQDLEAQRYLLGALHQELVKVKSQKAEELYAKILKGSKIDAKEYLNISNDEMLYNKIATHLKKANLDEKQLEEIKKDSKILADEWKGLNEKRLRHRFVVALGREAGRRKEGLGTV